MDDYSKLNNEIEWKEEPEDEWDELHPRRLIPELCRLFYQLEWGQSNGIEIENIMSSKRI